MCHRICVTGFPERHYGHDQIHNYVDDGEIGKKIICILGL